MINNTLCLYHGLMVIEILEHTLEIHSLIDEHVWDILSIGHLLCSVIYKFEQRPLVLCIT